MKLSRALPTSRILIWASFAFLAAWLCDLLNGWTWPFLPPVSSAFDGLALVLFWLSYAAFWIVLVLGPFRPFSEFSLHGSCRQRALNFGYALLGLIVVHVAIGVFVASLVA